MTKYGISRHSGRHGLCVSFAVLPVLALALTACGWSLYPVTNEMRFRTRTNAVPGSSTWGTNFWSTRRVIDPTTGLLVPGFDQYGRNTSGWVRGVLGQEWTTNHHIVHVHTLDSANSNWVYTPSGFPVQGTNWVPSSSSRLNFAGQPDRGAGHFYLRIPYAVAAYGGPQGTNEFESWRQYYFWLGPGRDTPKPVSYGTNETHFQIDLLGVAYTNVDLRLSRLGYIAYRWSATTNPPYYVAYYVTNDVYYPGVGDLGFFWDNRSPLGPGNQPLYEYLPGVPVNR